ncbi:hypothetical protein GCM10022237_24710 [Nocardioides ginsengisoli]
MDAFDQHVQKTVVDLVEGLVRHSRGLTRRADGQCVDASVEDYSPSVSTVRGVPATGRIGGGGRGSSPDSIDQKRNRVLTGERTGSAPMCVSAKRVSW